MLYSLKGTNPSYANPQGIEPSFDISHERIKGEHNREQKHKQSRQKTTTMQSTVTSTASSEKHVVASIFLIYTIFPFNLFLFFFLMFNIVLSDLT